MPIAEHEQAEKTKLAAGRPSHAPRADDALNQRIGGSTSQAASRQDLRSASALRALAVWAALHARVFDIAGVRPQESTVVILVRRRSAAQRRR